MTSSSVPLREFIISFADDEHLMGQQHTEWIGVAPFLEEDLAFSSIGQDELGHSVLLYELVIHLDNGHESGPATDEQIDALAFDRGATAYRSCAFTESVYQEWAHALVRHWIYDHFEQLRWGLVAETTYGPLAAITERVEREEHYHRLHANSLLDKLLADPTAKTKLRTALDELLPLIPTLLAATTGEGDLISEGVLANSVSSLGEPLARLIGERFGIDPPDLTTSEALRGPERSEHFAPLMARMREVIDYDLEATW